MPKEIECRHGAQSLSFAQTSLSECFRQSRKESEGEQNVRRSMTNPNINPEWQKRFNEHLSVTWRGTLPPHRETGEVAVFFDLPGGGTLRLRMPTHDARQLMGSLAYCLEQHHSDKSSDSPIASAEARIPVDHRVERVVGRLESFVSFRSENPGRDSPSETPAAHAPAGQASPPCQTLAEPQASRPASAAPGQAPAESPSQEPSE